MPSSDSSAFTARQWQVLVVLCLAMLFEGMNLASVNVQLPPLTADLGLSAGETQLVVSTYLTLFAGFMLLGGRVADILGRRRTFLLAVGLFGLGSLAAAIASGPAMLIAARAVQGVGAAFTVPAAMSLITTTFAEGPARNKALGVWASVAGSGFAVGLLVSGLLTELFGWRSGFLLYVVVAAGIVLAAALVLPRDGRGAGGGRLELAGPLTGTLGLLAVVYGAGRLEVDLAEGLVALGAGLLLLAAFIWIERASDDPLFPVSIFGSAPVRAANFVAFSFFAGVSGMSLMAALYLQEVLDYGPFAAGLAFLPLALFSVVANPRGAQIIGRRGPRFGLAIGSAAVAAGVALVALIGPDDRLLTVVIPGTLLMGAGIALVYPGATIAAVTGVPNERHGVASGLMLTSQQAGGALGVAAATGLASIVNGGSVAAGAGDLPGLRAGILLSAAIAAAGIVATLLAYRRAQSPSVAPALQ